MAKDPHHVSAQSQNQLHQYNDNDKERELTEIQGQTSVEGAVLGSSEESESLSFEEQKILLVKNKNRQQLHSPLKHMLTTPHRPTKQSHQQKKFPITPSISSNTTTTPSSSRFFTAALSTISSPLKHSYTSKANDKSLNNAVETNISDDNEMQLDSTTSAVTTTTTTTPRKKKVIPAMGSPEK